MAPWEIGLVYLETTRSSVPQEPRASNIVAGFLGVLAPWREMLLERLDGELTSTAFPAPAGQMRRPPPAAPPRPPKGPPPPSFGSSPSRRRIPQSGLVHSTRLWEIASETINAMTVQHRLPDLHAGSVARPRRGMERRMRRDPGLGFGRIDWVDSFRMSQDYRGAIRTRAVLW